MTNPTGKGQTRGAPNPATRESQFSLDFFAAGERAAAAERAAYEEQVANDEKRQRKGRARRRIARVLILLVAAAAAIAGGAALARWQRGDEGIDIGVAAVRGAAPTAPRPAVPAAATAPARTAVPPPLAGPPTEVLIARDGYWVAGPDRQPRLVPACAGGRDTGRLAAELCAVRAAGAGAHLALAADDATYGDAIAAMDAAAAVGFSEVGIVDRSSLVASFPGQGPASAAPGPCGPAPACATATPASDQRPVLHADAGSPEISAAPHVVVSVTGAVALDGQAIADRRDGWKVTELYDRLSARPRPAAVGAPGAMLVVKAERATQVRLLVDVLRTVQAAGYQNLLFAAPAD